MKTSKLIGWVTVLLAVACSANAEELTIAHAATMAVTRGGITTQEPFDSTHVSTTRFEYDKCNAGDAFGTPDGEWLVVGDSTVAQVPPLPDGRWCFRAYTSCAIEGYECVESEASAVLAVDLPLEASVPPVVQPGPPGLTVIATGERYAYQIRQSGNRVSLVPVGVVAPGTECDENQPVMGAYVVPRESVTFAGSVQPSVVVAACEVAP